MSIAETSDLKNGNVPFPTAIAEAANAYTFTVGGIEVPAPLVARAKLTPEEFAIAADAAYSDLFPDGHGEHDSPKLTLTQRLAERGTGIDCSGFVTSVLDRALSTVGVEGFRERIPHPDAHTGYNVFPLETLSTDPAYIAAAEQRQALLEEGRLDSDTRVDYDMQRIVDNSTEVTDGTLQAGDVILYDPVDELKDPHQLGHAALVTGVKGGRVKVAHSGGKSETYPGGVSRFSLPVRRFTEAPTGRTTLAVRRLDVLSQ